MDNTKIIDGLNDLLSKTYDSERGYKNAAEKVDSYSLSAFFRTKASNRYVFGKQIKQLIEDLGGTPDKGTSFLGDMHNAWINFKSALSSDKEESVLEAVETGEEACVNEYDEFLKLENLPYNIRRVISDQRTQVAHALRKVEQYEEMHD